MYLSPLRGADNDFVARIDNMGNERHRARAGLRAHSSTRAKLECAPMTGPSIARAIMTSEKHRLIKPPALYRGSELTSCPSGNHKLELRNSPLH